MPGDEREGQVAAAGRPGRRAKSGQRRPADAIHDSSPKIQTSIVATNPSASAPVFRTRRRDFKHATLPFTTPTSDLPSCPGGMAKAWRPASSRADRRRRRPRRRRAQRHGPPNRHGGRSRTITPPSGQCDIHQPAYRQQPPRARLAHAPAPIGYRTRPAGVHAAWSS